MAAPDRSKFQAAMKQVDAECFRARCQATALARLPKYLAALRTEKRKHFDSQGYDDESLAEAMDAPSHHGGHTGQMWFFQDVLGAIFELMDRRVAQVQKRLAMTEVV